MSIATDPPELMGSSRSIHLDWKSYPVGEPIFAPLASADLPLFERLIYPCPALDPIRKRCKREVT